MNKYIALDVETGGITLDTTLLTAYFAILDENLTLVDELYLSLKPDDGIYRVTANGLSVNKIDLIEHDKIAISLKAGGTALYKFLDKNRADGKLTPIGHGLNFDLQRVKQDLINVGTWENFVSYRTLDTSIVCQFLRSCAKFPDDVSGSLGSLVDYFNIPLTPFDKLHNARVDTLLTVEVLKKLKELI